MNEGKSASKIHVQYDDGSTEILEKAFVGSFNKSIEMDSSETVTVEFLFVGLSGREVEGFIISVMRLGQKLGMFGRGNDDPYDDEDLAELEDL